MYLKGDFHIHTIASDGEMTPSQIINLAKDNNFDIISITDHDSTSSIKQAVTYGEKVGVKVIPGIELSTIYNDEIIHILGYFKNDNYNNKLFQNFLNELKNFRVTRGIKMVENINKLFNIHIDYKDVESLAKGVVQRPHIAKAILKKGYPYSINYIFDKIIGKDSPAYVPNRHITTEEGISLLKNLGALVVLAHPILIKKSNIYELLKLNFDGIEAIYPLHSKDDIRKFKQLAKKHNKFITAGSDTHELNDKNKEHGIIGSVALVGKELNVFISKLNLVD